MNDDIDEPRLPLTLWGTPPGPYVPREPNLRIPVRHVVTEGPQSSTPRPRPPTTRKLGPWTPGRP